MKSTGIARKVDELGRIVIPIELRRTLGIERNDSIDIFVEGESIILKKYQPQDGAVQKVRSLLMTFSEDEVLKALTKLEQKKDPCANTSRKITT